VSRGTGKSRRWAGIQLTANARPRMICRQLLDGGHYRKAEMIMSLAKTPRSLKSKMALGRCLLCAPGGLARGSSSLAGFPGKRKEDGVHGTPYRLSPPSVLRPLSSASRALRVSVAEIRAKQSQFVDRGISDKSPAGKGLGEAIADYADAKTKPISPVRRAGCLRRASVPARLCRRCRAGPLLSQGEPAPP
jgi:hypothetical protein